MGYHWLKYKYLLTHSEYSEYSVSVKFCVAFHFVYRPLAYFSF